MFEESLVSALLVDLAALSQGATSTGPQWGHASEDLNLTLLHWTPGQAVAPHVNDEVDVVLMVVAGSGEVTVNGVVHTLVPGHVLVIPKGAERAIRATTDLSYLSVHRRRRGLWPTIANQPRPGA
jgi:quercetin dioxygenase-like cupin family protein